MFSPQLIGLLDSYYVIRFNLRDTGRSTAFPLTADASTPPPYLLQDLIADIVGLIDHLAIPLHIASFSLGRPLAFAAAAQRPHMTKSLFLAITSPVGLEAHDGLPPAHTLDPELVARLGLPPVPSEHEDIWIDYLQRSQFLLYTQPPDEEEVRQQRAISQEVYRRGIGNGTLLSNLNHTYTLLHSGRWPREALRDIAYPALVISAALDQTFDVVRGKTLAADLGAKAEFILYRDTGHKLPKRIWGKLSTDIIRTVARGESWWERRE